jgi:Ca-activated chloride channel family protein
MTIQGISARKRAAVRVCALLAPLVAAGACRTGDSPDSIEELTASVADRGPPEPSRVPMAPAQPKSGGGLSNLSGGDLHAASAATNAAPDDDLDSLKPSSFTSRSVARGVVGHAAAEKREVAKQRAEADRLATGAGADRFATGTSGAGAVAGPSQARFGLIGLANAPAASAARPSAPWENEGVMAEPVAPVLARLDPNARYATTYRPGGAALAAFDAAVSRGQIPTSYKDLVGDFGARYAPAIDAPKEGALTIAVRTARASVGPLGGPLNLLVALASSEETPPRAPLSVHIVLDVSGSMSGPAIEDAKRAAEAAVGKLESGDDFSMVTFSDSAQVIVPDGPIGPRRAQVLSRIHGVQAGGGTNIWAGLDLGYAEARAPGAGDEAVRLVMLLSDGHANGGDTSPEHLADRAARAFQDGIQTSAFGLGPDYDAALMSGIADRGAGGYYYVADSSQIEPALAREIDARLRPVATAVEVRVRLRPDVSATHVFGSRELTAIEASAVRTQEMAVDRHEKEHGIASDRQVDSEGGMRFFIPAFARADRHATMITLQLPPGAGERRIASVEVRYKDRVLKKNVTQELPVNLRWAPTDADSALTADRDVERVEQAFAAGEAILQAAGRVDAGDRTGARNLLEERSAVLRIASSTLGEARLADDASRLERLADAVEGHQPMAELPLVVMLRGSGYGYL